MNLKSHCPTCRQPCPPLVYQNVEILSIEQYLVSKFPLYYQQKNIEELLREVDKSIDRSFFSTYLMKLDMVVFPGQPVRLNLFEERYLVMFNRALSGDKKIIIHASGLQGEIGSVVKIDSYHFIGNLVKLEIIGIKKCRFLHDSEPEEADRQLGLCRADVQLFDDDDWNTSEDDLSQEDSVHVRRLIGAATFFLRYLGRGDLRELNILAGPAPSGHQWHDWSQWLCYAIRMSEPDMRLLFLSTSGAERMRKIYTLLLQSSRKIAIFLESELYLNTTEENLNQSFERHIMAREFLGIHQVHDNNKFMYSLLTLVGIFLYLFLYYKYPSMFQSY